MLDTPLRLFPRRAAAFLLTCSLASAAGAELITVGPLANGCDFDNLVGAIVRAALTPEGDTIAIATNRTFTSSTALILSNEANVTMRGVQSCSNTARFRRTITATRGDLLDFRSTNLTIEALRLTADLDGDRLITADGGMLVTLDDSQIDNGMAVDGGNILLTDGASLLIEGDARVALGNATFNGGGIHCSGGGTVALLQGAVVDSNTAANNGGGIYASGCAVNVLSGGTGAGGVFLGVSDNTAEGDGGGIYARAGADVIVAGTSTTPATIAGNRARGEGGGVALGGASTVVTIQDSEVMDNEAFGLGGGLFVFSNAMLTMERTLGNCNRDDRCSFLGRNTSGGPIGAINFGGALAVEGGGQAEILQTYLTLNDAADAGNVIWVDGTGSFVLVESSVFYDNSSRGTHVLASNGGVARLAFISAWGSSVSGNGMIFAQAEAGGTVGLFSSLVIEGNGTSPTGGPPDRVFGPPGTGGIYQADCVFGHEIASLPTGRGTMMARTDPASIWANPAAGDPHLLPAGDAVDYCDTVIYTPVGSDLDLEARGIDAPISNFLGPFDIGADESPGILPPEIFADGFESGNTSAWTLTVP
ncbi:MAG: hypothetical protein K0U98_25750 [Deltaproteobacteria bacterium]|nr:hypothetical protein [Deltaproteobacteria bacterium]